MRNSKSFRTKREAEAWAAARETKMRDQDSMPTGLRHTRAETMLHYIDEVSPTKRGERWERVRVKAFLRDPNFPAGKVGEITPEMIGWDDELVFGLSAQTLDALFRRHRVRCGLEGFTFHDFAPHGGNMDGAIPKWPWCITTRRHRILPSDFDPG